MIEYAKTILPKVSFSEELFRKELVKCINWMNPKELVEFRKWCFSKFYCVYPLIIEEAFRHIAA
jgi:hypothetical protein